MSKSVLLHFPSKRERTAAWGPLLALSFAVNPTKSSSSSSSSSMEIVRFDGSIAAHIEPGQTQELGRGKVLDSSDQTISRRQISFFVPPLTKDQETRAQFEILGRNPVYVSKGDEVKVFRRSEKGEMGNGEMFCVSAKNPVWYTLKEIENGGEGVRRNDLESELAESLESDYGFESVEDLQQEGVDVSNIDPVKEFGFLVIGHEFDSYPKKIIHDVMNWDWFLEESEKDSDEDDDDDGKRRKASKRSRKRKKGEDNDDDEWTGESEDEKVLINKSNSDQKPKYVTRSKDRGKRARKDKSKSRNVPGKQNQGVDEEDQEDEDEDDETLGGFIVDDENLEEAIEDEDEEEEEEEELVDEDEDE